MRTYKLGFINNIKRGFLTVPLGIGTCVFIINLFRIDNMLLWQKLILTIILGLLGLPGIMLHLYYLGHDRNVRIYGIPGNDFFVFEKNRQTIKILKSDIESIDKIFRNASPITPWYGYMMFNIKIRNGTVYSITNLSIEFDDLYELSRIKGRQLKISDKYRFL